MKVMLIHPVLIIYLQTVGKSRQSFLLRATNCLVSVSNVLLTLCFFSFFDKHSKLQETLFLFN